MAGTFRRPVPNDPHRNTRGWPDEHFDFMVKESKRLGVSIDALVLRGIEALAMMRGEFAAGGVQVREKCDCGTPLIHGKSVDEKMARKGFVTCKYCVSEAKRWREDWINQKERQAREQRANGGPTPIRPHPAITRG